MDFDKKNVNFEKSIAKLTNNFDKTEEISNNVEQNTTENEVENNQKQYNNAENILLNESCTNNEQMELMHEYNIKCEVTESENHFMFQANHGGQYQYNEMVQEFASNLQSNVAELGESSQNNPEVNFDKDDISYLNNPLLEKKIKNISILDGTYFQVLKVHSRENIEVLCQICWPTRKILKGALDVTTNFVKHLKRVHPQNYDEYLMYKQSKRGKRKIYFDNANYCYKVAKPNNFTEFSSVNLNASTSNSAVTQNIEITNNPNQNIATIPVSNLITQTEFDSRLIKFLINAMPQLSLLENESFINLFQGFNVNVFNKLEAITKITTLYELQKDKLKRKIKNAEFLCTTLVTFCENNRVYIFITIHWIDNEFKRHSAVLSCGTMPNNGEYTLNLAEYLEDINLKFGINETKIVALVANSTKYFLNSLKKYEFDESVNDNDAEIANQIKNFKKFSSDLDKKFSAIKLNKVANICHEILGIITTECKSQLVTDEVVLNRHNQAFEKLTDLWGKVDEQRTIEIMEKVVGRTISQPKSKMWSSMYNAIIELLNEKNKLANLFDQLELNSLKETEIQYLEEYRMVMKPFSIMLDVLSQENSYYGYLLPCLVSVKNKLEKLQSQKLKYGGRLLLDSCIESFNKKFIHILNLSSKDVVIAAVLCPNFKLRWYNVIKNSTTVTIDCIKEMIVSEAEKLFEILDLDEMKDKSDDSNAFFDFNEFENDSPPSTDVKEERSSNWNKELQLLRYLNDTRTNIEMLNDYPILKKLFTKFNTCLPSSSLVEGLFSYDTIRNASELSNDIFEKLVLLKANKFSQEINT